MPPLPTPGDRDAFGREASPPPDFRERWPKGGGGGFSRAKGADALLPVCLTPHLGTPIPLPPPTGHLTYPHLPTLHPTGHLWPPHRAKVPRPNWPKGGTGHLRPLTGHTGVGCTGLPLTPLPTRLSHWPQKGLQGFRRDRLTANCKVTPYLFSS